MSIRSARARSVSRYSAMVTRGNALPGGRQNVVGRVGGESIAVGMCEHLLVSAHLLVAGKGGPSGKLSLRRHGRWHNADWFICGLRHTGTIAPIWIGNKKGPGKTGALDISEPKTDQRE